MCCIQYDPVVMRRFDEEPDEPIPFGTYKSEAAIALTKTVHEEEDDE